MITVQMPDGSSIRVNTTDPAAASAAAKKYLAKSQAPAAPVEPAAPPEKDYGTPFGPPRPEGPQGDVARPAQVAAQGVGRGVANILGLPADALLLGVNLANKAGTAAVRGTTNLFLPEKEKLTTTAPWIEGKDIPGTSDSIKNLFSDAYGAAGGETIPEEQMSGNEKLATNTLDFGTQALTGGAGLAKTAAKRVAEEGAPKLFDHILEPYVKNKTKTIAGDVASGVGAGAGLTASQEYMPDSPIADLFAMMGGGLAGGATAALASGGKNMIKEMVKPPFSDIPYDKEAPLAGRFVTNKVADKARAILADNAPDVKGSDIASVMDSFLNEGLPAPTLGTGTGDLGLLGLEEPMRRANPQAFIRSDMNAKEAAAKQVQSIRPEGVDETALRGPKNYAEDQAATMRARASGAKEMAANKLEEAQLQEKQLGQKQAELAAPISAIGDDKARIRAESGKALDQQITEGALKERTTGKNTRFDTAIESAGPRDAKPLVNLVDKINSRISTLSPEEAGVPAEFAQGIQALLPKMKAASTGVLDSTGADITKQVNEGGSGKIAMKDIYDVRKYLSKAIPGAERKGNFGLKGDLVELKKGLNDEVDRLATESGPGSAEAKDAQKYYREEYAPYFAEGFGKDFRDTVQRQGKDRIDTPPSTVADWWLGGQSVPGEKVKDLKRIISIAPNPDQAEKAVRNYMIANMSGVARNGAIDPGALRTWVANNGVILDQFPKLKTEVTELQKAAINNRDKGLQLGQDIKNFSGELRSATQHQGEVERQINDSALGIFINNSPRNAAAEVLARGGDPEKRMDSVMAMIAKAPKDRQKDLKDAWTAAVSDHILEKVRNSQLTNEGKDTISYGALIKEMRANSAVLAKTVDPEGMQALNRAQKVMEPLMNLNIRAGRGSNTVEENVKQRKLMAALEIGLKEYYGGLAGGNKMRNLRLLGKRFGGADQGPFVARLLERTFTDPEVAKLMFSRDVKAESGPAWNRALGRRLALGQMAREENDVDTESEYK